MSELPKPYKTGVEAGIPIVKVLLRPSVKNLVDLMNKFKGCYIGINETGPWLYIDNKPAIKVHPFAIDDMKIILADDMREYHDIIEYRLLPERYREILTYYL